GPTRSCVWRASKHPPAFFLVRRQRRGRSNVLHRRVGVSRREVTQRLADGFDCAGPVRLAIRHPRRRGGEIGAPCAVRGTFAPGGRRQQRRVRETPAACSSWIQAFTPDVGKYRMLRGKAIRELDDGGALL